MIVPLRHLTSLLRMPLYSFASSAELVRSVAGNYHLSTPLFTLGHRPPVREESVHGKYAGVLFSVAS